MQTFRPHSAWLLITLFWLTLIGCQSTEPPTPTLVAIQPTATTTQTPTATVTVTPSPTATNTPTPAPTLTPSSTPSPTPSPTATATPHPLADLPLEIVFSSFLDRGSSAQIYRMSFGDEQWQPLTDNDGSSFSPQTAPDGSKIAFTSEQGGTPQIYLMNPDGTEQTPLTTHTSTNRDPFWSPDSSQLVFASDRDGFSRLYLINADGSGERPLLTQEMWGYSPTWSPDGQWIAFSGSMDGEEDPNIYIVQPDGSGLQRMTFSPSYDGDQASWSPDSQWLIFPSQRLGNYEIYALKIDGSQFGALTYSEADDFSAYLSPDGRYLLLNIYAETHVGLVIRDLATGEEIPLTDETTSTSFATWLPQPEMAFDDSWLINALLEDTTCIYAEDEEYGYTAETPLPIGNGPQFGGAFDGFNAYTFLRVTPDEPQTFARLHTFPSNSRGEILDTLLLESASGEEVVLYVNINDYSPPQIPVNLFCDLTLP